VSKITQQIKKEENYKVLAGEILSKYGIVFILGIMIILLSIISNSFLTVKNITNVIRQISIIGIIGLGVTFIIITGGIDLSSGSVAALASVFCASFAHPNQYPLIVPILVGLSIGAFCGFINGGIIASQGIPPFIATLGMQLAARGAAYLYTNARPITGFTKGFDTIGRGYVDLGIVNIPVPIIIFFLTCLLCHIVLKYTKFGKYVYAIGGNRQAAVVSGINVKKVLVMVYAFGGMLVGLSAIILTSRLSAGQPTAADGYELDAIAAATIGGVSHSGGIGSIGGTIIGALIIGILNNGLDLLQVNAYWQQIAKGVIIVGAVILDKHKRK
jgi:inositol transport system permease protein